MADTANLILDGRHFVPVFNDDFSDLDISAAPGDRARWHAGLPYGGGYGASYFIRQGGAADLGDPDLPFTVNDGVLRIRCRHANPRDVHWHTGLLSSVDANFKGFTFTIGDYVEVRAKMPAGGGKSWPASWGVTDTVGATRGELDWFEWYGRAPTSIQVGMATWHYDTKKHVNDGTGLIDVGIDFRQDFHTFGAYLGPRHTVFYIDRIELFRAPTHDFHQRHAFNLMLNNQIEPDWQRNPPPDPFDVWFDYARVYRQTG